MKYISEERLRELLVGNNDQLTVLDLLKECKELNPWQPISIAPKDRRILLFYPDFDMQLTGRYKTIDGFGLYKEFEHKYPTHWQELPPNPL